VHLAPLALGAGKLAALIGGLASKKHVASLLIKAVQKFGVRRTVRVIREVNDQLLAAGGHSAQVHSTVTSGLNNLESSLTSLCQSDQLREIQEWLAHVERESPELVVALGKAYLETTPSAKVAKAVIGDFQASDSPAPQQIAGLTIEEWQRRVHEVFPELQGYKVLLKPEKQPINK